MKKLATSKAAIIAWCTYDWANSAFSAVIITFVFSTYFTKAVAANAVIGTAQWGKAIALAGLIIALLSPFFGAIADCQGRRKPWLAIFTLLAIISASLMWFIKPELNYVNKALILVVVGTVGLEINMVFYNAMLRDLAPKDYLGRISGWAWGCGYIGGLICLSITLFGFVQNSHNWLGLDLQADEQIRIAGPLVAFWLALFSLPLFFFTPDKPATGIRLSTAVGRGVKTLFTTLRQLPMYKSMLIFLIAQMIYMDGLNTLFAFGGIYAAGTFGMSFAEILQFGIAMNITAGLGAVTFAWLDDYVGAKSTILIALSAIVILGISLLVINTKLWFWILALTLGLFVGPTQAASRSLMARMVPAKLATEMFGLYAFSGKITAFMGPWLLASITLLFNSQRLGMITVILFMLVGGLLLLKVRVSDPVLGNPV